MLYKIMRRTFLSLGSISSFIIIYQKRIQSILFLVLFAYIIIHFNEAFADPSFKIPGTDKSAQLTDANDLTSTLIGFAEKTLAPALAVVCAIGGVHRCAKKKNEEGIPLILGAVGLVFIGRIMDTISKIFN